MLLEVVVLEESVVNASLFALQVLQHWFDTPVETVARPHKALGVSQVPALSPWRNEGGEVAVLLVERHAVISFQHIRDRLPRLLRE